jgi:hypothetical protein
MIKFNIATVMLSNPELVEGLSKRDLRLENNELNQKHPIVDV